MKLDVINRFLIVCFTMVQKIFKSENIYKICTKISFNGYKTTFRENALYLQSIQEKIFFFFYQLFFPQFQSTKHFVDQVLADYNGYYRQESGKSDIYGFCWCPTEKFS